MTKKFIQLHKDNFIFVFINNTLYIEKILDACPKHCGREYYIRTFYDEYYIPIDNALRSSSWSGKPNLIAFPNMKEFLEYLVKHPQTNTWTSCNIYNTYNNRYVARTSQEVFKICKNDKTFLRRKCEL